MSLSNDQSKAVNDIWQTIGILFPHFHGNHAVGVINSTMSDYQNIFPAWMVNSCAIVTFSLWNEDSLTEAQFKAAKGPAFIIHPTNLYKFFNDALNGASVGEAFYNVDKTYVRYFSNSNNLFGDPSLHLFGKSR